MSSPRDHPQDPPQGHPHNHLLSPEPDHEGYFSGYSALFPDHMRSPIGEAHPILDTGGWVPRDNLSAPLLNFEEEGGVGESSTARQFLPYNSAGLFGGSLIQLPPAPEELVGTGGVPNQVYASVGDNNTDAAVAATAEPAKNQGNSGGSGGSAESSPGRRLPELRKPRVRERWQMSDAHEVVSENHSFGNSLHEMRSGTGSGRNLLAKFGDDDTPRLKFNVMIKRPKEDKNVEAVKTWPDPTKEHLPAKTSLEEICKNYPRHVWGTGLRIFGSEGWDAKRIYDKLPEDFKHKGAKTRQWNYLQAALGRELDKMVEEEGRPRSAIKRGGKRKTPGEDEVEDETQERGPKERPCLRLASPVHSPSMQPPSVLTATWQPPAAASRGYTQVPTVQHQMMGTHTPQPMFAGPATTPQFTGTANTPPMHQNTMLTAGSMMMPPRGALQQDVQQLSYFCRQERRRHHTLLHSLFSARHIEFMAWEEHMRNWTVESSWDGRLRSYANSIRQQLQHEARSEVPDLNDVVRILEHGFRVHQKGWGPEMIRREAWIAMYRVLLRWTAEWGG